MKSLPFQTSGLHAEYADRVAGATAGHDFDVDKDTLMVTPEAVEAAITRTKAIIPVHYAGAPWKSTPILMPSANVTVFRLLKMRPMPPERTTRTVMWGWKGTAIFPSTPLKYDLRGRRPGGHG